MLAGMGSSNHQGESAISVVMTTYNGALYLEEQIESILSQTHPPAEFIVCDDQSTDGTIQILEKYAEMGRLQYFVNPEQLGVVANFKKAVSLASKENYIALSDQDDIWLPEKLEWSLSALQKIEQPDKPAMVYSDLVLVDQNNQELAASFSKILGSNKYKHCLETLLYGNFVTGCTLLMNPLMASFFSDIPTNPHINHDSWMALIGFSFGKAKYLAEKTIRYRKHSENVTIATIPKNNRYTRLFNHLKYSIQKNDYLAEEFKLLRLFLEKYASQISPKDASLIEQFLSLENSSYPQKKWAFEKAFLTQWTNRF